MNGDICQEPVGGMCSALNVLYECGDCRVSEAEVICVPLGSEKQKRGEYQGLLVQSPRAASWSKSCLLATAWAHRGQEGEGRTCSVLSPGLETSEG